MASKAVRGVQLAAKGVGEAFTGGRDLHQMLHSLASTTVAVEAYFAQPCFQRVLPEELKGWAKSLCGEAKEAHERLSLRVERMEKDGVRGAAESSLHALSSAAGAITGIAILDVGRHIADELIHVTSALNDLLARATRLVTLTNAVMLEQMADKMGMDKSSLPNAQSISPELTRYEVDTINPRLWVHPLDEGSSVAGDRLTVTWETIGSVPLVNVRFKNCMGIESSRGKTVLRFTREQGESNKGTSTGVVPFDFPPGKYTLAVSDPANNIRGMTFVSILRPISVAEIIEPPWGMKNLSWRNTTWSRGTTHTIKWKMYKGKASIVGCYIVIGPSSEGPWRVLRGGNDLKFRAPDLHNMHNKRLREQIISEGITSVEAAQVTGASVDRLTLRTGRDEEEAVDDEGALWKPAEDEDDEGKDKEREKERLGIAAGVVSPMSPSSKQEWFYDEKVDGQPRKSHSNPSSSVAAAAANMGSTLTGLFGGGWPQPKGVDGPGSGQGQAPPGAAHQSPSKMAIEGSVEVDDVFEYVIETMDCSFDWMVPIDIEPGKYVLRIVPTGWEPHCDKNAENSKDRWLKFGPEDQARRARESGTIVIS